jgi:hypothetical protein
MQEAPARVRADAEAVERFREVSEPLIAAIGRALDDPAEYGNARRGYARARWPTYCMRSSSLREHASRPAS